MNDFIIKTGEVKLNVIKLNIENSTVVGRLITRAICKNNDCQTVYSLHPESKLLPKRPNICDICESDLVKRADDEEAAIKDRLSIYHKHAQELIKYYQVVGGYKGELNVEQPLEKVFYQFKDLVGLKSL